MLFVWNKSFEFPSFVVSTYSLYKPINHTYI